LFLSVVVSEQVPEQFVGCPPGQVHVLPLQVPPTGQLTHAVPHAVPELHWIPQPLPTHTALPLPDVGPGQLVLQALPQLFGSALETHVPLHMWVAPVQLHVPPEHAWPPGHECPQAPQLALSVFVLTHADPQGVPDEQLIPQTSLLQVALPLPAVGPGHVRQEPPLVPVPH
jgi:hypothetical protein